MPAFLEQQAHARPVHQSSIRVKYWLYRSVSNGKQLTTAIPRVTSGHNLFSSASCGPPASALVEAGGRESTGGPNHSLHPPSVLGAARSTNTALDRSERCRQNGSNFWGSTLLVAGPRPGKKTWADKHSNQRWGLGLAHRCSSLKLAIAFKGRVLKHPGHLHASAPCHPTGLGEAISATQFFVLGWPYAPKSCIDHSADYLAVIFGNRI